MVYYGNNNRQTCDQLNTPTREVLWFWRTFPASPWAFFESHMDTQFFTHITEDLWALKIPALDTAILAYIKAVIESEGNGYTVVEHSYQHFANHLHRDKTTIIRCFKRLFDGGYLVKIDEVGYRNCNIYVLGDRCQNATSENTTGVNTPPEGCQNATSSGVNTPPVPVSIRHPLTNSNQQVTKETNIVCDSFENCPDYHGLKGRQWDQVNKRT